MGSASHYILAIIFGKGFEEIFTTRDFLRCGTRSAVDKALGRYVQRGIIKRLARGVFARDGFRAQKFSDDQIARVKATSFGRQVRAIYGMARVNTERSMLRARTRQYFIDGGSSSFKIEDRVVTFKGRSKKQMMLPDSTAGRALSVLWFSGKCAMSMNQARFALSCFSNREREEVWVAMRWMPGWLQAGFKNLTLPLRTPREFIKWLAA